MKTDITTWKFWIVAGLCVVGLVTPSEAGERFVLGSEARVHGPVLDLASLLTAEAPASVRELARHVDLGRTPQPGHSRVLTRDFVLDRIRNVPELADVLEVPPTLVVRRQERPLRSADVRSVVDSALRTAGCTELVGRTDNLVFPVLAVDTETEPTVEVLSVAMDSLRSEVQFRMRIGELPGRPDFLATLAVAPAGAGESCLLEGASPRRRRRSLAAAEAEKGDVLARIGQPATLQAVGRGLRLYATVVPLENGREGDVVRVRNTDTQGIVTARVIGPDLLERGF